MGHLFVVLLELTAGCLPKAVRPLAAFTAVLAIASPTSAGVLDYGNAFFFAPDSTVNRLFIEVTGRMRFEHDGKRKEYHLLYTHPREDTWRDDGLVYDTMIKRSRGPSTISFMLSTDGDAVISRRYRPLPWKTEFRAPAHHCGPSPYLDGNQIFPKELAADRFAELHNFEDVLNAAKDGAQILGLIAYTADDGTEVEIDFPVRVLNIKPAPKEGGEVTGKQWQVASSRIPIYVGKGDGCQNVRYGHVAFGDFDTKLNFVYLCPTGFLKTSSDYSCTVSYQGHAKLFRRAVAPTALEPEYGK